MAIILVFLQSELTGTRVDIFGDNEGAKEIADNPSSTSRSKHIGVKLLFIRGLIRGREISIVNVGTEEKHADALTKPAWRKNRAHSVDGFSANKMSYFVGWS